MADRHASPSPIWLTALGALGVVLIAAGACWAVAIALENFSRIGV